jgi:hypothetical protein
MSDEIQSSASESHQWHAAARQRDADDIVSGRLTAEQVGQRNSFIPNAAEWQPVDHGSFLNELYEDDDAIEAMHLDGA